MDFGKGGRGLGTGMADDAAMDMELRQAYQQYAEDAMMNGQQPTPYPEWVQQMMQQQPPTPAPSQGAIGNPGMMAQVLRGA